jgi:uncharacterized membrane protein
MLGSNIVDAGTEIIYSRVPQGRVNNMVNNYRTEISVNMY